MRRRRLGALLAVGVLAGLSTVVPAGAAHAAETLELSVDGVTWSASLPEKLFTTPAVLVPGDVLTSVLWVRNSSGDPARVELEVADDLGARPGTFAGDLSLTIDGTPSAGGSTWRGPDLAPGSIARVALALTFAASSGSTSQSGVATVLDSVSLVQSAVGRAPGTPAARPGAAPTTTAGGLAHTGADVGHGLVAAVGALAAGLLLLAARRRSRRDPD
ncbi:hypothetical protein [uncultured Cellulomonas sp.]|uniref:hypothetical protein n=1 Tax=uncultured Cellulomonas sp. TaxID=189682 RepID=UPI0028E3F565|nr:hypothetical protein [uncultured Cellulomonas sp.]